MTPDDLAAAVSAVPAALDERAELLREIEALRTLLRDAVDGVAHWRARARAKLGDGV